MYKALKTFYHVSFSPTPLSQLNYERSINMKQKIAIMNLGMFNIQCSQIDPKHNRKQEIEN